MYRTRRILPLVLPPGLIVPVVLAFALTGCEPFSLGGQYNGRWTELVEGPIEAYRGQRFGLKFTLTADGSYDVEGSWRYSTPGAEPVYGLLRGTAILGENGYPKMLTISGEFTDCLGDPVGSFDVEGQFWPFGKDMIGRFSGETGDFTTTDSYFAFQLPGLYSPYPEFCS